MAFFQCNFHSAALGMEAPVNVIFPQHQASATQIGMKSGRDADLPPVLYLLHGQSDDHTIWMRRTSIERYAAQYGIAIVMPNGHRSYYSNLSSGMRFWDYVSQELPGLIADAFRVSTRREDTFIAGLSMGGFGTLRLAMRCPERFAAAGAMSSVIDPDWLLHPSLNGAYNSLYRDCFGDAPLPGSEFDLFHLADEMVSSCKTKGAMPRFFITCGESDGFFKRNAEFAGYLESKGVDAQWHPTPGNHSWELWDKQIQKILEWLQLNKH